MVTIGSRRGPAPSQTKRPKPARRAEWWSWSFIPLAAVYLGLTAIHLSNILTNVYGDADASSAPALGQSTPTGPAAMS